MSQFNDESNNSAFWYDKSEYYAEYGLALRTKKDSKSRNMKELEKAEQRKKKVDDIVSSLPNKMQKKIAQIAVPNKQLDLGKSTKQINYVSRQNTREDVAYNEDYHEEEEVNDMDDDYQQGLELWLRYGLTKEQYDADLEHREDIAALDAFENDPENYHASSDYGEVLRRKIKKFEDNIEAKEREHDLLYPDYPDEDDLVQKCQLHEADIDWHLYEVQTILDNYRAIIEENCRAIVEEDLFEEDQEDEADLFEEDQEDEADIAERYREDRFESAIENARDDMRED